MATANIYDLVDTWNDGATTFTAIKMNVTDTASASGSLLMDLQVGSASKFAISSAGHIGIGTTPSPSFSIKASATVSAYQYSISANAGALYWTDLSLTRKGAANLRFGAADAGTSATVTITSANPGVVTWGGHVLSTGSPVKFTTTGTLPTNIVAGTVYYVIRVNSSTFQLATSFANALAATAIDTSGGSPSGTHTGYKGAAAQKLSVQSSSTLTDFPGADMVIEGSQGTGTGAGGSILFKVAPAGGAGSGQNGLATALTINSARQILAETTSNSAPAFSFSGASSTGFSARGAVGVLVSASTAVAEFTSAGEIRVGGTSYFSWANTASADPAAASDVRLYRDAPATLALRNGANAQTFRVYNTYTGSADEWLEMSWLSNAAYLTTGVNGGSARSLTVRTSGSQALFLGSSGTNRWRVESTGHFLAHLDNTYDIGASGATRPRTVYVADNVVTGATDFMHETSAALADGAGANTATMTNSPAAGNPTKWIAINDNGTTRYIPAW